MKEEEDPARLELLFVVLLQKSRDKGEGGGEAAVLTDKGCRRW